MDTHARDGVLTLPEATTWKKFVDLLNETFNLRKTKDKARVYLSILKHKPGKLEEYIMDFTALASWEKIETQKEPPEKIKDIIGDARKFDKSYYKNQAWKMKVMGWQPNHSLPHQFPQASFTPKEQDPNAMDIDRLTIKE